MFGTWPRGNLTRVAIVHELNKMPGQQLVLVRYKPHNPGDWEWVWNAADIDGAKIVWARDMGAEANRELLSYFKGRTVWCIEGDDRAPQPLPCAY
jgi:hypothetical protein